jgi:hypothetical protein
LLLAFSGGEGLEQELERSAFRPQLEAFSNVELAELPGDDHILRPIAAQRGFARLLDAHLASVLGTVQTKNPNVEANQDG